ncbi:MAG: DNA polymerase I [Bacteroidales bacterium]|nr:DNA polymerase I [Bacteroidales bacterium]MDT8431162.1 DNA polymerase I [Bacteroidales bacterium]
MSEPKKLFLLDSYALIFRSYYAFLKNPMRNNSGMNTSTVFGFTLTLDELLRKEAPTHIMAAFDASGPTFRHELYEPYKANRDATPEDIKESIPWVKDLLTAYQIPVIEKLGYEADDIIGTIAKKAEKEGFEVYMVTPDKDFAQLVSERIYMYKPARSGNGAEILGIDQVKEKFRVEEPHQVIDILALWGDASDNIPGAPGIGEKTAKKLIESFGSIDGVYENISSLKGKQRENLENAQEQVRLSRKLATIIVDASIEYDLGLAERKPIEKAKLSAIFDALNFKNLHSRILGEEEIISNSQKGQQESLFGETIQSAGAPATSSKNIHTQPHAYHLVTGEKDINSMLDRLEELDKFCFDSETTGLDTIDSKIVGLSFCWKAHEAYYIDLSAYDPVPESIIARLKKVFGNSERLVIGQNLKYDLHMLKNYGIEVTGSLFDTMVAHYLVVPERKHGLDAMAEEYFGYTKVKTEEMIGKKGARQQNFRDLDPEKVKDYACEDADITWLLYEVLEKELKEKGVDTLAWDIEMPLVRVLMEMEHAGVSLDRKGLADFAEDLRNELIGIEKRIFELAGQEFNVGSPRQLGEILFDKLKIIPDAKKTKTKQYSTGEDILITLVDKHEIVQQVLNYRSEKKLLNTYVDALPKLVHPATGRIHTSFNQTLVTTGRLSSNNPNLQNIPIREERGREIRKAFTSSDAQHRFLSADYSQIELRLMAHLSKDENMIRAFIEKEDIHTTTASKVYNVPIDEVTKDMRSRAKTANFGIIYGISAFGLSQRMRIPRSEAKELIDGYFNTYPSVRTFMDKCIEKAREKGYVETIFGRRRYLPDIHSRNSMIRGNAERNAINTPIQGTAADIIKIAMVSVFRAFREKGLSTEMIIQVHDELNFNVPLNELETVQKIVRNSMEQAVELSVPLEIDMNHGSNWLEAH